MLPQSWFVARSITRASTTAEFLLSDQIVSYHNRSPLNGGSGLTGKSGRKTANACGANVSAMTIRDYCTSHARRTIL